MMNTPFRKTCGLLLTSGLFGMTGCASFFGPYFPEEELPPIEQAAQENAAEEVDVSSTGTVRLSNLDDTAAVTSPQPDASEAAATPVAAITPPIPTTPTVTAANPFLAPTQAEQKPAVPDHSDAPADENPFAAMAREGVIQVAYAEPHSAPGHLPGSTVREAEPRLPTPGDSFTSEVVAASPAVQAYPDEYIIDGGDRDFPVHYAGGELQGLDTEDTVVEFQTHDGKNNIQPSNRVAVYAPRFGAVRTVSGPGIDVKVDKPAGATDVASVGSLHENKAVNAGVHRAAAGGLGTKTVASGVETMVPPQMSERAEAFVQFSKVEQGLESLATRGANLLRTSDVQKLDVTIIGPEQSNADTAIGISASTSQSTQTYSTFRVQELSGSEEGGRPGKVHITKEAWPLVAKAGDVITFTIRFQNVGDYSVSDVRIIDNLTPRLIYVADSGKITVTGGTAGDLSVVPNSEGSEMLVFELDEPLPAGETGTIVFNAKVL